MSARKILVSIGFNYLGVLTISVLGFLTTPIILHHLGRPVYGQWGLLTAIIGYSSLLDFGIGITVMRLVAERSHLSDRRELEAITSTGLILYSVLGVIVCAAGIVVAIFSGSAFHFQGDHQQSFMISLMIMSVVMGITFPAGLYTGINQGFGHYKQQSLIVIGQNVGGTVIGVTTVVLGGDLVSLTLAWTVFAILGFVAKMIYARRAFGLAPSLRRFDRPAARLLMTTSAWMSIINLAGKVIWDTDVVITGAILGTVAVAHYTVALGPATAVRSVADQFTSVSLTAAAGFKARDERDALSRLMLESTRGVAIVIAPVLVLFAIWGRQFLTLWVGPALASSAGTLVVLVAGMLAASLQSASAQVLISLGRQRIIAIVSVVEALANTALSIILAKRLGIIGVALGTAIPTTITGTCVYVPYAAHLLGISPRRIVSRLTLPAAVCAVAYAFGKTVLAWRLAFSSLAEFMLFAVCFIGVLALASILLDDEERGTYLGLLKTWRRQVESTEG